MLLSSGLRIDTGTKSVFADYPNGEMWNGYGPRQKAVHVDYEKPFAAAPVVTLSIARFDSGKEANVRLATQAVDQTAAGFTIVVSTWEDTKLAEVSVTWLAVGE